MADSTLAPAWSRASRPVWPELLARLVHRGDVLHRRARRNRYLALTGRAASHVKLVEAYAKAQGLFREPGTEAQYDETIEMDLSLVEPSLAGPKRPQDRVSLTKAKTGFQKLLPTMMTEKKGKPASGGTASAVAVLEPPPTVRLKPETFPDCHHCTGSRSCKSTPPVAASAAR